MARLLFTTDASGYAQNDTVTGTLSLDTEGETFGAAHIRAYFPAYAFDSVLHQQIGFAPPDTWVPTGPSGDYGIVEVACSTALAPTGLIPIFSFTARVVGARGSTADLAADLLSGSTNDGANLVADRVELSLPIAVGNAGFLTVALPDGQATVPYHAIISGQGGSPPYAFAVSQGALPSGLTLHTLGLVEGTPAFVGQSTVTVRLTDSGSPPSPVAELAFTIDVIEAPPRILTDELPTAAIGRAYSVDLSRDGGTNPVRWTAEGLPAGLSVNGNRITGTPNSDRHTVGVYGVKLRATDSSAEPRIAERDLEMIVLPAYSFASVEVDSPGEVAVARDMFVATYDVTLEAAGALAQRDQELVDAHRAMEEALMTDIFNAMLFEETMTDPMERQRFREGIGILLNEYKEVKRAGREATELGTRAELFIDDVHVTAVGSKLAGLKLTDWNVRHSITGGEPRRKGQRQDRREFSRAMKKRPREFSEWMMRALDDALGPGRSRRRSRKRKGDRVEEMVLTKVSRLRKALDDLDFDFSDFWQPDEEGRATVRLTPGAHRVRVMWTVASFVPPGSIVGVMEAAGATASYTVTLDPRNPNNWPRLQGSTTVSGGGGRSGNQSQDVSIVGSDEDILVVSNGAVRLVAATGKESQPFAAPVAFEALGTSTATRISARVADDIGRTSVAAIRNDRVRVAANIGPGGFAGAQAQAAAGTERYSAVAFGPIPDSGRSAIHVAAGPQIITHWVSESEPGTIAGALVSAGSEVPGRVRGDNVASVFATTLSAGEKRFFAAREWAGSIDELTADAGTFSLLGSLPGTSGLDPRRDPLDAIVGEFAPGAEMVVASLSQASSVHAWRRTGTSWTSMEPVRFPFRTGRICHGMGPQGGIGMLSRAGGYVVLIWWPAVNEEARRVPVDLGGNATAIASTPAQLVISYGSLDRIEIFRPV